MGDFDPLEAGPAPLIPGAARPADRFYTPTMLRRVWPLLLLLVAVRPALGFDWIGKIELDAEGLQDNDPQTRRNAVQRLSNYDIDIVKPHLLKALRDSDSRVRIAAGRILGRNKVAEAAPIVIEWLNDPDRDTKQTATEILADIGTDQAVAALIRTLGDLDFNVRLRAIEALAKVGSPAVVVPLIGRVEDEKSEVRLAAVEALRQIGDRRAMIPLVAAFDDSSLKVRTAAVIAVGSLGDRAAVPALVRLLDDNLEAIRVAAVQSLGNLAAAEATDVLVPMLGQGSAELQSKVAFALGQIAKSPASGPADVDLAITALVKSLAGPGQRAAAEALRNVGSRAVPMLVAHLEGEIEGDPDTAVELLRDIGDPRATPALIAELSRGRISNALLLDALGKTGDSRAVVPILALLSSPDATVRLQAMRALAPLLGHDPGNDQAADVLVGLLDDPELEIQVMAIDYIGRLRANNAVPKLLELASAGHKLRLRAAALGALGEIADPRATELLLGILEHGPEPLFPLAANALIYIADPSSVERLLAMTHSFDGPGLHHVVRVLGGVLRDRNNDAARRRLEQLASDGSTLVSLAAIASLGAMRDPASVPTLVELARSYNPHRQRAAVEALGNLGGPQALEAAIGALRSSDDRTSGAAAWALGKLLSAPVGATGAPTRVDPDLAEALVVAARQRGWATAINATAALARMGAGDPEKLLPLLHHRDRLVRVNAAAALGRRQVRAAQRPLTRLVETDESWLVRIAAARALGDLAASGTGSIAPVLKQVADTDPNDQVRAAASAALAGRFVPPPRTDWRNFYFVDPDNDDAPVRQEPYFLSTSDGLVTAFYTDERGEAGEEQFPPGDYIIAPKSTTSEY